MRRCFGLFLLPLLVLALASAPALAGKREKLLDQTLMDYASTLRWGGFEQGLSFLQPGWRETNPISSVELSRYRQVRVSYYHAQSPVTVSKNEIQQLVEIGVINEHSQSERVVVDRQTWRYDEENKHWWLVSGPPNLARKDE